MLNSVYIPPTFRRKTPACLLQRLPNLKKPRGKRSRKRGSILYGSVFRKPTAIISLMASPMIIRWVTPPKRVSGRHAEPFYFFDLQKNEETTLLVHPFVLMDGVYIQYHPTAAEEIPEKILPLIAKVKALNGTFISLFHNNAFCDTPEMRHWRRIYENMIKRLTE